MRYKIIRLVSFIVLTVFAMFCLSSCSQYVRNNDFYAGEYITPEDIESLYDAVVGQNVINGEGSMSPEGANGVTVYWTSGGSVYHTDPTCRHYADSSEKNQGSIELAVKLGKKELCSVCKKHQDAESGYDKINSNDSDDINTSKGEDVYDIP